MGWDGCYDWKTPADARADFNASLGADWKLIDQATVSGGRRFWSLIEGPDKVRYIVCCLVQRSGGCWMRKDMDESMGPFYYDCPLRLLDASEPGDGETARAWRQNVRRFHRGEPVVQAT